MPARTRSRSGRVSISAANHIDRFERSCSRLRFTSPYSREQIRDILDRCCAPTGFENAYLQMIMTRGCPPIGQRDLRKAVNRFQLFCLRYVWIASPEVQERGMHVMVSPIRRVPPEIRGSRGEALPLARFRHGSLQCL